MPVTTPQPIVEIAITYAYCQQIGHEFKNYPFVDDKLKWLLREEFITSLSHVTMNTPTIHVGVFVPQIQSQSSLVIHPTLINQHLNWQQSITPLITWQPRVMPYPPNLMWYNTIPPFIPMDHDMYSMDNSGIKEPNPLISRRRERYATGIAQIELVPPIEQL